MAEPFEITTDLISFYSEYSVVMMRYSFLIYKYIYMQMLTAYKGQLASFVCVMSYVFKFSIAYIHVYNDEKKPWTVMVRGFSCTCNKQEGKRFQITSVTVLLSLSNIPAIYHSFPYPQKPLHTTPSIGHHMSSYCYGYTQGNARIHETWPDGDNYADGHPEESHQNKHRYNNN